MGDKLSDADYLIYVVMTNYLTIFSGVLYLLAFIMVGLIAQRFSRVFGVRTHWPLMFAGPVGALVYSVYTIVHGGGPTGSQGVLSLERWIAYGSFLGCGVLCWWGVRKFWLALESLVREGRQLQYLKYGKRSRV